MDLARTCRIETGPSEPWTTADTNTFLATVAVYSVVGAYVWYRTAIAMGAKTRVVPGRREYDMSNREWVERPATFEPEHDTDYVVMLSVLMGLFWPVMVPGYYVAKHTARIIGRKEN